MFVRLQKRKMTEWSTIYLCSLGFSENTRLSIMPYYNTQWHFNDFIAQCRLVERCHGLSKNLTATSCIIRCIRVFGFFTTEFRSRNLLTKKRILKKASFTFGRGLWPKVREHNSATESSTLGRCQGYRKETWLLHSDNESRTIVWL